LVAKVTVMTGFRLPPLAADYNQLWLEAELRGTGNGRGWALRAAAELLSRPQWARFRTRRGERSLIALLEQAAVIARKQQGASMGLILIPSPEEGIKGMAAFCPVDLAGHAGEEAWEELLEQLAPEFPGDYPREITPMETRAGPCRRLRLRYAGGHGPERLLGEHIGYLWVFEEYGAAVMMTISFPDIAQAALWLPALDELALSVWLQR
jgi:hypothetical protein